MRIHNFLMSSTRSHSAFVHSVSRLFQPLNIVPVQAETKYNDITSKSQKLMVDNGVIHPAHNGLYHLLPLGTRAIEKLIKLVDKEMGIIGAQKISLPFLTNAKLWETTGRKETAGKELFSVTDRHEKPYVLSPTHEESITHLLASLPPFSYKHFPLLLYQITTKFRDEMKPRFGLIRAREFLMKDLYSFDTNKDSAEKTYHKLYEAYHKIFRTIGVKYVDVLGDTGLMGGSLSHEFHYPAAVGDDTLLICGKCGLGKNKVVTSGQDVCGHCGARDLVETKGIEVGHTFLLDTRYSAPLQALFSGPNGKETLMMGSYGLGLTRILASALEVLSLPDQLRWPPLLAPYTCLIITPKEGSKESKVVGNLPIELYEALQQIPSCEDNVIVDDRSSFTIGRRLIEAKRTGYPLIAVIGKDATATPSLIELHDVTSNQCLRLTQSELLSYLANDRGLSEVAVNSHS